MNEQHSTGSAEKVTIPRWTDRSDKHWPVEVVPAWAYDGLKREYDKVVEQLRAELKWRRDNSND